MNFYHYVNDLNTGSKAIRVSGTKSNLQNSNAVQCHLKIVKSVYTRTCIRKPRKVHSKLLVEAISGE